MTADISSFFFFLSFFIYFERERETTSRGWGREGERERIPSRLPTASPEPDVGLKPTNCEIRT